MPDLGERLRTLRYIEKAADAAEQRSLGSQATQAFETRIQRELKMLNDDLPNYELIEPLHRGGQGILYKAVQLSTNRVVVVKILLHGILATDQQLRRFEQEVRLVGRLRHPNIVTLYDSGMACGYPYYVMELIDGLPIDDFVFLQRLSLYKRVELFITVCRAISYAHQQGVIHRDLKPSNILVCRDGHPRVLDFGLAKDTFGEGKPPISLSVQIVGTLPYLSPEQAALKPSQVSVLSDIYTLGVILFQILSEAFPYPVAGPSEAVRENIIHKDPARLRDVMDDEDLDRTFRPNEISRDLESILHKALEKDSADRYQSAASFADDLERYLSGEPVEAMLKDPVYIARKWLWRHRWGSAVATTFAVTVVTLLVAWNVSLIRTTRTAQAGLQMGGLLHLGSVERDDGRVDNAVLMFREAIEIGEGAPQQDKPILELMFRAHQRIAELSFARAEWAAAEKHAEQAIRTSGDLLRAAPRDKNALRFRGFALRLLGRSVAARGDWNSAVAHFTDALAVRQALFDADESNDSLCIELAKLHGLLGKALHKVAKEEESLSHYLAYRDLSERLVARNPESREYKIGLIFSDLKLVAWHLRRKSQPSDVLASRMLDEIETRCARGVFVGREFDAERVNKAIAHNRRVVEGRYASSSSSISAASSSPSASGVDSPTKVNE